MLKEQKKYRTTSQELETMKTEVIALLMKGANGKDGDEIKFRKRLGQKLIEEQAKLLK